MESYEQLTGRMYRSFEELAGYSPDDASDLGIRMKVLAAEYGLTRKPAQKAQGVLRFSIGEDGWYSITIPRGSVCTTADGAVNFVTTQEAVLAAGSRYVLVPAAAEQAGRAGNVRAGPQKLQDPLVNGGNSLFQRDGARRSGRAVQQMHPSSALQIGVVFHRIPQAADLGKAQLKAV